MTARCVMVLGTTSGAGKSWLTTALCRWFANQGLKVAPFKAQNMSNNARVVAPTLVTSCTALPPEGAAFGLGAARRSNLGGEIGSAQYFQALAARAIPDVRMNPLAAQARARHPQPGGVDGAGERRALAHGLARAQRQRVAGDCAGAGRAAAENDLVVIEGAGSPAEINLHDSDIVNMRVALHCPGALPAGDRYRPRRRVCPPVRHLGIAAP
jgi:adenosylcobyric acid synthase